MAIPTEPWVVVLAAGDGSRLIEWTRDGSGRSVPGVDLGAVVRQHVEDPSVVDLDTELAQHTARLGDDLFLEFGIDAVGGRVFILGCFFGFLFRSFHFCFGSCFHFQFWQGVSVHLADGCQRDRCQ